MESHDELRPYRFAIAYRMLGSIGDAEDVVQETFLRFRAGGVEPESPKAYLATIATRIAIDHLRSARVQREDYPGEWLPEPLADAAAAQHAEMADSLSLTFLHLLEKLSPVERAIFLLRKLFDYPYDDVAAIVGRSPAGCRQILSRAHTHIDRGRRRFDVSRAERDNVARRFVDAWESGDTDALIEVLAPDVVLYGDGGGKAPAVRRPLVGAARIAKALIGWRLLAIERGASYRTAHVNGERGIIYRLPDRSVASVQVLEIVGGLVVAVRAVVKPDKLARLGGSRSTGAD
jgi:RNA polymerase sigma-70 factor (ECF subfamily)